MQEDLPCNKDITIIGHKREDWFVIFCGGF